MSGQPTASTTSKVPTPRFPSERMGFQGQTASQAAAFLRAQAAGYQSQTPVSSGASAGSATTTSSPATTAAATNGSATAAATSSPTVVATANRPDTVAESLMGPNKDIAQKYLNELDARPFISSPKPQTIDSKTFLGHKFVTADGLISTTRQLYDDISGTYQWDIWEEQTESCMNFITEKCAKRRVFLVVSGSVGQRFVPLIHELPQVYAIYVFCGTVQFHLEWSKRYEKVRVVCSDDDQYLLPQLAVDVARSSMDWGDALLKKGDPDARALAKSKFEKAKKNLTEYVKKPDPDMVAEVEQRLKQCM